MGHGPVHQRIDFDMIGVSMTIRGDKVDRGLQSLSRSVNKTIVLNKKLGIAGVRWVLKNFDRQGKPRWQNLKETTANARIRPGSPRRRGSGHILVSNGLYRASFASNPTAKSVRIGSPWKISIVHEEGRGHMPKRMALPTKAQAEREIIQPVTGQFIKAIIKESDLG